VCDIVYTCGADSLLLAYRSQQVIMFHMC